MSSFAKLSPQLLLLGNALRTALILGGTGYLQDLLLPMNLSDAWLGPQLC
jgi:3-oxoadipate enol-lactonase